MQTDIVNRLRKLVITINPSCESLIQDGNEKMIEDLGFDSVSIMTLLADVELEFNIGFDDEMIFVDNFYTINSLSEYIEKKMVEPNE